MSRLSNGSNFANYLTVGQAAQFLGVSAATLRNWDRSGKLKPGRHPHNGYRIYLRDDLEAVLLSANVSKSAAEGTSRAASLSRFDWSQMRDSDHFVQFYENDNYLIETVAAYVAAALAAEQATVVIATALHRDGIQRRLAASGVDLAAAIESGNYIALDANDTLAKITKNGVPDAELYHQHVGSLVARLLSEGRPVRAFGEMVALLWLAGERHGAIRLEEFWNSLAKTHKFGLLCAYPIAAFADASHAVPFQEICASHTRVIPAESFAGIASADERLRAVALLQQQAQTLSTETRQRRDIERKLWRLERSCSDLHCDTSVCTPTTADAQQRDATSLAIPADPSNERQRILVVDDNHDSGRTLSLLLRAKGHEVRTASDGLAAIEIATEFLPHVILMDIGMPKLDGYDTTRRLRELPCGKDAKIVALTGWGLPEDVRRSDEAGCTAHLVKPVGFAELEQLLAIWSATC